MTFFQRAVTGEDLRKAVQASYEESERKANKSSSLATKNSFEVYVQKLRRRFGEVDLEVARTTFEQIQEREQQERVRIQVRRKQILMRLEVIVPAITGALVALAGLFPPVNLGSSDRIVLRKFAYLFAPSPYSQIDAGAWFVEIFAVLAIGWLALLVIRNIKKII